MYVHIAQRIILAALEWTVVVCLGFFGDFRTVAGKNTVVLEGANTRKIDLLSACYLSACYGKMQTTSIHKCR